LHYCIICPEDIYHFIHRHRIKKLIIFSHDVALQGWNGTYKSLALGETRSGWQIGKNTHLPFYAWIDEPENFQEAKLAHRFFQHQFQGVRSWLDDIDFKATYAQNIRNEDVAFVDVGGGNGQESEKLIKRVPDIVGKVIHQDLPGVLERAPSTEGVQKMAYDYFTEQPVKGEYNESEI
jgi:hypothetical protein